MWRMLPLFQVAHQRFVSGAHQSVSFDNEVAAGFSERSADPGHEVLSAAVVVGGQHGRQSPWCLDAARAVGGRGQFVQPVNWPGLFRWAIMARARPPVR